MSGGPRRGRAALGLLLVCGAALAAWALWPVAPSQVNGDDEVAAAQTASPRQRERSTTRASAGRHCAFEQRQRFTFSFASDLTSTVRAENLLGTALSAPASAPESIHVSSAGRLHALVMAVTSASEAIVAVRPDAWSFEPAGVGESTPWRADLERPYLVRVGPDCRMLDVARHRDASVAAFAQVIGLLDHVQLSVPDDPAATPTWMTRQQDEYGISSWRYTWTRGDGGGAIRRERVNFETSVAPSGALGVVFSGTTVGDIALGEGPWFERLVDTEDVVGASRGAPVFSFAGTTRFERAEADAEGFLGHAVRVEEFVWGRPTAEAVEAAQGDSRDGALTGVALGDIRSRFAAIRAAGAAGSWREGQELLRAWILANPEQVHDLVGLLRAGVIDEHEAAEWALALARSGSDVAQRELEALAADGTAGENLRIQATSALADLRTPDQQTIDTLTALSARVTGTSSTIWSARPRRWRSGH